MRRGSLGQGCPRKGDFSQVGSTKNFVPTSVVYTSTDINLFSWSKQIIEHERAEAAKEAATKG